jgi:hypothetical protein
MSTLRQSIAIRRSGELACWVRAEDNQTTLLAVTWQGIYWILPWSQLVSARLEGTTLDFTFGNCVVVVTGENLPALLDDIAAYRISVLRQMPAGYRQKTTEGEPFISRIEVRSVPNLSHSDSSA